MAAKMLQRKLKTSDNNDEKKEKSGLFRIWEEENRKWREHYDAHVKAGRPVKNAKALGNLLSLLTRVAGYVCGLKMMHRRQGSDANTSWFRFPGLPPEEERNLSFRERWQKHVDRKKKQGNDWLSVFFMRALMVFQAPTQIYAFMYYIIPYVFEGYSPWTVYYMKVLAWYVLMNGLANWLCVILYDPHYPKTKDNPFLQVDKQYETPPDRFIAPIEQATSNQNELNGHCVYDMTSKEALPWNFCKECKMHVPPRTHHCNFCKKCILKRDHHCFMVGNCIGFTNQRYFIVLAFYAMITGVVGGYFTFKYVREVVWPDLESWSDVFFPITIFRSLLGDIKGINCLLIVHIYLEFLFGVIGFVYFTSQMTISANGKTLFEVAKKVPIRNMNTINRNFKSVFGDFWALNFLFPMTLIFRQRDDGIHWDGVKIDHNANEKWKDDGEVL